MMIERCPVCGSACRTAGVERLEDVAGLDHVKRALEVAAVGHHTVVLEALGNPRDASRLSEVAVALNVFTIVPLACPCGGYGSMAAQCICTVERLRAFRRRGLWRRAVQYGELFVEVREVPYEQISSTRPREAQARVLERIAAAQARPEMPTELVGASARLMQAAHRQLDFDAVTYARTLAVAATIARVDAADAIRPCHLAEAIQYRPDMRRLLLLGEISA